MNFGQIVSRHRWNIAAFAWGCAEATLFFIVPDVLLSLIGLKRGAKAGAVASVCAALGAGAGGVVLYFWSASDPEAAYAAVAAVPAISAEMMQRARAAIGEHWFYATVLGPLSSTPYKVFALFAPHAGVPIWAFAVGSVLARLPRFLLVSAGTAAISAWLRARAKLPNGAMATILAVCWIVFYALFFWLVTREPGIVVY